MTRLFVLSLFIPCFLVQAMVQDATKGLTRSEESISTQSLTRAEQDEHAASAKPHAAKDNDSHQITIDHSGHLASKHAEATEVHKEKHAEAPNPKKLAEAPDAKKAFDYDPDDEDDVALDELEAMTISTALTRKNWGPPPAVNCKWTPFGNEGVCSKTCGGGNQKQTRKKSPNAAHGGRGCSGAASQTIACKTDACPTTTTTTTTTTTMTTAAGAVRLADVPITLVLLLTSLTLAWA